MEELLWTTDELLTGDELDSGIAPLDEDSFEDEELPSTELDEASTLSLEKSSTLVLEESSPEQAVRNDRTKANTRRMDPRPIGQGRRNGEEVKEKIDSVLRIRSPYGSNIYFERNKRSPYSAEAPGTIYSCFMHRTAFASTGNSSNASS